MKNFQFPKQSAQKNHDDGNLLSDIKGLFQSFKSSEEAKADAISEQANPNTLLDEALTWMRIALFLAITYTIGLNGWVVFKNYSTAYGTYTALAATTLLVVLLELSKIKFGAMFFKSIAFGWLFRLKPQALVYVLAGVVSAFTFYQSYKISTHGVSQYASIEASNNLAVSDTNSVVTTTPRKAYDKNINSLLNERIDYKGQKLIREKSLTTAKNLSAAAIEAERNEGKRLEILSKGVEAKQKNIATMSNETAKQASQFGGYAEIIQLALLLAIAFCRRALVNMVASSPVQEPKNSKVTTIGFQVQTNSEDVRFNGHPMNKDATPTPRNPIGFRVDRSGNVIPSPHAEPVHPPLMPPLMPHVKGGNFEQVWLGLHGQKTEWLEANKELAKRVAERFVEIHSIAEKHGIGVGQAAQMLPQHLTINAIATDFNCSASQVNIVRRVVEHIELSKLIHQ